MLLLLIKGADLGSDSSYDPAFLVPLCKALLKADFTLDWHHFIVGFIVAYLTAALNFQETDLLGSVVLSLSSTDPLLRQAGFAVMAIAADALQTATFPEIDRVSGY